ncbi:MAG: hypothetical protein ABFR75_00615 [Acidobacteriota bacterium]
MRKLPAAILLCFVFTFSIFLYGDTLYTVDNKVYTGKLVAFKFDTVYFNVYKFGKISETKRFPLFKIHKIVFNPKKDMIESSFEIEQKYKKLRRGKRVKTIILKAGTKWMDTNIKLREKQSILFSTTGSIVIKGEQKVYQYGELNVSFHMQKQLPTQPTGAIIAKIGKEGTPFYIGANLAPFKINKAGKLFIGINDFNFDDNSGNFTVKIYY